MAASDLHRTFSIPAAMARCLELRSNRASPIDVVEALHQQVGLAWPAFEEPKAVAARFLVALVDQLIPEDGDKRVSFADRPGSAATKAVPYDYGTCIALALAMGWGNRRFEHPASTPREAAEAIRTQCHKEARVLALRLLEAWEKAGHVQRI